MNTQEIISSFEREIDSITDEIREIEKRIDKSKDKLVNKVLKQNWESLYSLLFERHDEFIKFLEKEVRGS